MCGIAGILTTNRDLPIGDSLERMQSKLHHRGPDDCGLEIIDTPEGVRIGLAHTRLAILDLSAAGHQPMSDPNSNSWIVYNGEIYNHAEIRQQLSLGPFRSASDTETLLQAWISQGESAISLLRGMFAFAVYDAQRQQFCLVRDRLGVKPLYVAQVDETTWLFASELRAVLASNLVPRRLDRDAAESYLAFGSAIAPRTLVDGVESIMPGHCWTFNLNQQHLQPRKTQYWRPQFATSASKAACRADAIEQIRNVIVESTRSRMLSDVPVGVFLSGGIDSSGLVACLANSGQPIRTFSVTFDENQFDESPHSSAIAERFGTNHAELRLRSSDVLAGFDDAMAAYDQPSADGLNSYFISRAVADAGLKVALSGLGGDELFAGYPTFRLMARLVSPRVRWAVGLALRLGKRLHGDARIDKLNDLLANYESPVDRYSACRHLSTRASRRRLLTKSGPPHSSLLPPELHESLEVLSRSLDPVNTHSLLETSIYLANVLLRDTDQMSMAHALEVRVPLVDHVLVETMATIPGAMKIARGTSSPLKGLLVDALPTPLPASIVRRRKMGFVLPWQRWLRAELRDRVAESLNDRDVCEQIGLDPQAVAAMWQDFQNGQPSVRHTDILSVLNLVEWTRRHGVSLHGAVLHDSPILNAVA